MPVPGVLAPGGLNPYTQIEGVPDSRPEGVKVSSSPPPYSPPIYSGSAAASAPPLENSLVDVFNAPFWKVALVAVVISLLVIGSVTLGLLTASLVSSGAFMWQIGLAGFGCAGLGLSAIFGLFSASENKMFENTPHNKKDAANFAVQTTCAVLYTFYIAIQAAEKLAICDLINALVKSGPRR